jgi:methylisocitrate lyase
MPYFLPQSASSELPGLALRHLLDRPGILQMPGAYNGMAALQAKAAGFESVYLSGAAMSASMGLPDIGVITIDDVCFFLRQVHGASGLPVLVDADTGFGEVLNVMHMTRIFEAAGAAAIQVEDQVLPKKCGHLNEKKLVDAHEMAAKIAAARRVRKDMLIVARTDAVASEGVEAAVARAKLYVAAGADIVFPEALTSRDMLKDFATRLDVPLLANMTEFGRTPYFTASEFEELGYKIVIWPVSALRVAAKAQEQLYGVLSRDGVVGEAINVMQTRAELYATIDYHRYEAIDKEIAGLAPRSV